MKLKLLSLCMAQLARADIMVKVALCSSTDTTYNGYAWQGWTAQGDGDITLKISFDTVEPTVRTFTRASFVFPLTEIDTSWFVQKTPWHIQSQNLRGIELDDVETVQVEFGAYDILCLETLEISDPNCAEGAKCERFNILQKYDNHNYDPVDMQEAMPPNVKDWVSATGKKITFWTDDCVADARPLSKSTPFQESCHDTNTFTIVERDECADGSHNCVENATCKDTRTSFKCLCKSPYVGYPYIVDPSFYPTLGEPCHIPEEDECENGTHDCDSNSICIDMDDGFTCECKTGYEKRGGSCKDEDECKDGSHSCDVNEQCTNIDGSFSCDCKEGFVVVNGECEDDDECENDNPCGVNEQCTNTEGGFDCGCNEGYEKKGGECVDDDECKDGTHDCGENEQCTNTDGSFSCDCKEGFVVVNGECKDDDECDNDNPCGVNEKCTNTIGSFDCGCNEGYEKKGGECVDDDECKDGTHDCGENEQCTNTDGSFECICKEGYTIGRGKCIDADECKDGSHNCGENEECTNTNGSFDCECSEGYVKKGGECVDDDECKDGTHDCGENEQCVNTDGSFACICEEGYTRSKGKCIDENECSDGSHTCGENEECTNTNGSFDCGCSKGYHKQGGICVDDDECKDGTHNCDFNEKCVNVDGSFSCDCKVGFVLVDNECEDDDECANDNQCGEHGECSNTEGSFDCGCKDGYQKRAGVCVDTDECRKHDHPCGDAPDLSGHAESICSNTDGGYECDCPEGYEGDAYNGGCYQNDECKDGTHSCVVHSTCVNNDEDYDCVCHEGYVGNGKDECFKDDVDGLCRQPNVDYGDWLFPWPKIRGCQYPTCEATYEVVDAWKRATNQRNKPWTYGWSIVISVPPHQYDGERDGWSVLVRLPADIEKGSFQVWNAKFWNFYEDDKGYFVMIHSKWSTVRDLAHKHSFNLVVERTSVYALPALLFWDNRQKIHSCFQPSMHLGGGGHRNLHQSLEDFLKGNKQSMADEDEGVRKLIISNGKIVRAF